MEALLKASISGELPAEVSFVGSDNPDAKGLKTAEVLGAKTLVFNYKKLGRMDAEKSIANAVEETGSDWIVLAGFMKILSSDFVGRFPDRIVNIHPSLLPAFPGAHGIRDAWEAGAAYTGVTVHIVDEKVDHGRILAQERVDIIANDTAESLEERIHKVEHRIYKDTLKKLFKEYPV